VILVVAGVTPAARQPTFRAGIDLVSVSVTVRDEKGRMVRNLSREDFEVFDAGFRRPIVEFRADEAGPVSVALLFDVSGSMQVSWKIDDARQTAEHVLSWLNPGHDEVAVYAFDTTLREIHPFSTSVESVAATIRGFEPFGATSLYDAVAQTAERAVKRTNRRRGVVVLTDGVDNASRLTPAEVSGIASAIDVPVYVVAVASPLDRPDVRGTVTSQAEQVALGNLDKLAWWTGGDRFIVSGPADRSKAARQLLSELRHQYVIAFEAGGVPGWHPLDIRTRDRDHNVRARSGYMAGQNRPLGQNQEE
jgi:Ca-activated chloride channel family protein